MKDCMNLTRLSCHYYTQFDHATQDFPILFSKVHEKGAQHLQPKKKFQMIRAKPLEKCLCVGPKWFTSPTVESDYMDNEKQGDMQI